MRKFVPFLIRCKVYIDRARMYYGYAQFLTLVLLLLHSFGIPIKTMYIVLGIPAFVCFSVVLGWLDYKLGFFQEEAKRHSSLNPVYKQILDKLDDIIDRH